MIKFNETYRLKKMARLAAGENILDVGCTDMPNPFLNQSNVCGLDIKNSALPSNYKKIFVVNVFDLPADIYEKFDSIILGEIIEHVNDPVLFLRKCTTLLKSGGKIILSTPNPHSPIETFLNFFLIRKYFYTKEHTMLYPQRWLIRIMENAGLSQVRLYSGGIQVPFLGLMPFPRPFCYQTIATGEFHGEN